MKTYIIVITLVFFIFSCNSETGFEPSTIYYGEDICERCKMIISESDFAAQFFLSNHKVQKFDDLGCMLHSLNDYKDTERVVSMIYTKDYISKKWIDGKRAYYVLNKDINTPMGHGIIAFKNEDEARKIKGHFLGNFEKIVEWTNKTSN